MVEWTDVQRVATLAVLLVDYSVWNLVVVMVGWKVGSKAVRLDAIEVAKMAE